MEGAVEVARPGAVGLEVIASRFVADDEAHVRNVRAVERASIEESAIDENRGREETGDKGWKGNIPKADDWIRAVPISVEPA